MVTSVEKVEAHTVIRFLHLQGKSAREIAVYQEGVPSYDTMVCQDKKVEFFDHLIMTDECWVYHYDPETKEMSEHWKHADSLQAKKAKSQPSSGKVMLSMFWDRWGVIMTNYA
ncbi:uncharacterized protein LOC111864064 [Cryptotermes secundus]|uniref:uncharacterized protein LOC111864064 n=1 Tax=Cryptotermes secundus TaxID=105785 RepID=UPI000CD7ABD2|nr:uncharacterized protein LOC111864064 [Cryptotermes secundus]